MIDITTMELRAVRALHQRYERLSAMVAPKWLLPSAVAAHRNRLAARRAREYQRVSHRHQHGSGRTFDNSGWCRFCR